MKCGRTHEESVSAGNLLYQYVGYGDRIKLIIYNYLATGVDSSCWQYEDFGKANSAIRYVQTDKKKKRKEKMSASYDNSKNSYNFERILSCEAVL